MKAVLLTLLALPFLAFSQTEKGVIPINPKSEIQNTAGATAGAGLRTAGAGLRPVTRAVVIGISDYQDAGIPDLRFADRDAEAFANFLRSPAGGSLDNDHLHVLTNQNATAGRVAEALDGLIEQAKEGDEVIIYFSGHGDVEGKKLTQPGFLLCWDSPSRVYMGGGTYSLSFLQEVVSTLSVQNKARVVVITDACHAGKLAGSQIGGAAITGANLARQYANEVKILSCQPNEFSLEGEQWGGGRGIFSYHLVDGLFGLADRNGDGSVTVGEIDRYLEDKVTAEAAPQSQVPMLLGNKTERLATVNPGLLADLKKSKVGGMPVFTATESRGLEDEVLAKLDSGTVKKYFAFKKAVAEKRFFPVPTQSGEPSDDCAEAFYTALATEPRMAPLHGFMKRNYAAALQDDSQQVMNNWLASKPQQMHFSIKTRLEKYGPYPQYLKRAAQLLGTKHYMYPALMARAYFFEAYLLSVTTRKPDRAMGEEVMALLKEAEKFQPGLPHVQWQKSVAFAYCFDDPDSTDFYARKAMEAQSAWLIPCTVAAGIFMNKFMQFERARQFIEAASAIDSTSVLVIQAWADFYHLQKMLDQAEPYYLKAIQADPLVSIPYLNLAVLYQTQKRYEQAEAMYKKSLLLDSTRAETNGNYGMLLRKMGRMGEAEIFTKKSLELNPSFSHGYVNLGLIYESTGRPSLSEEVYLKATQLDPKNQPAWMNLARLKARQGQQDAFIFLEKAIETGFKELGSLQSDPDFEKIRNLPQWESLMKKYLPEKTKD